MSNVRYRVTIEKVTREVHEVELDGDNIMSVFDEVRHLADQRNLKSHNGKYYITKIETKETESK